MSNSTLKDVVNYVLKGMLDVPVEQEMQIAAKLVIDSNLNTTDAVLALRTYPEHFSEVRNFSEMAIYRIRRQVSDLLCYRRFVMSCPTEWKMTVEGQFHAELEEFRLFLRQHRYTLIDDRVVRNVWLTLGEYTTIERRLLSHHSSSKSISGVSAHERKVMNCLKPHLLYRVFRQLGTRREAELGFIAFVEMYGAVPLVVQEENTRLVVSTGLDDQPIKTEPDTGVMEDTEWGSWQTVQ